jgi:hypothetical protein|tara:strand:- start:1755 stop:1901 length:147 start_codon:yes stop_codon:yes gene_type:complete
MRNREVLLRADIGAFYNETPHTVLHTARPQAAAFAEEQRQIEEYFPAI